MKTFLTVIITCCFFLSSFSQVVIRSDQKAFIGKGGLFGTKEIITELNFPVIRQDDAASEGKPTGMAKFAVARDVSVQAFDGVVPEVSGEYLVYRKKITVAKAPYIKLIFDKLVLAPAAELYFYTPGGSVITGPVTQSENIGEGRTWGTNSFPGNTVILELKTPKNNKAVNVLHLSRVLAGLPPSETTVNPRDSSAFGRCGYASGCHINVLCSQGSGYVDERKAVCMIETNDGGWGSAALVTNSCYTNKPYVLTAWHNTQAGNPNNWTYIFGWWSNTCTPSTCNQTALLFNGAYLRATYEPTDFSLLELYQTPASNLDMTYLGWSRTATAATSTACISHPAGDQMKISFDYSAPVIGNVRLNVNKAWRVTWDAGTVEPGSSGSPLLNEDKRVIGQLFSNTQVCNGPTGGSNYGRFDLSWTGGGTSATRLSDWLDPSGSAVTTTNTTSVANLLPTSMSLTLSGSSQICSGNSVYTLTGAPAGHTIVWALSNGNATYTSSGNTATVTHVSNGDVTLTATIGGTNCIPGNMAAKTIKLGVYNDYEVQINGYTMIPVNYTNSWTYDQSKYNISNVAWYWASGWTCFTGCSNSFYAVLKSPATASTGNIGFTFTNCGVNNVNATKWVAWGYGGPSYRISPNPASNVIKVEELDNESNAVRREMNIEMIEIVDKTGIVVYTRKINGKTYGALNIPIGQLKPDFYTLRIFNGKQWSGHKIIVKR